MRSLLALLAITFLAPHAKAFTYAFKLPQAEETSPSANMPWFTGPLLTPSGHVIPNGHLNVEPYQYFTVSYGFFDQNWAPHSAPKFYTAQTQIPFQYGFANKFDFTVSPNAYWKHTQGVSQWSFGDASFQLDYQLLNDTPGSWWPAIRLTAYLNIPFGKFQKLKASNYGTDISGSGAWLPSAGISISRLFTMKHNHFLGARFFFGYAPTVPVHVQGLNAYGGGKGTRGTAYAGNSFQGLIGLEYNLTQNWTLALDIDYEHNNKTRFKGKTSVPVGFPSSEQLSFAPAIEYNWSAYVGIIAGCWFTVLGRNSSEFASGIVAVNIYR